MYSKLKLIPSKLLNLINKVKAFTYSKFKKYVNPTKPLATITHIDSIPWLKKYKGKK